MKRGVPKKIESPEIMGEHFDNYCEWVKNNPIKVHDFVGKDGTEVYRERERPLTMEGFECWLYDQGIISDLSHYFSNKDGRYSDFVAICRIIRQKIRNHQIDGGMAGIFNPSITQRLNGLTEKQEVKHDGTVEIVMTKGKTLL